MACLALASLIAACSSTTTVQPNNNKDGGSQGPDSGLGKSGTASCGQTVTCVAACPTNDNACADACVYAANPNGQVLLLALVDCINKNTCADSACVQAKCSSELSACVNDTETAPADAGPPPVMASPLPADLVGTWQHIAGDYGQSYTFNANGSWSGIFLYDNSGSCITIRKLATSTDGVAQAQGNALTLTRVTVSVTTTDCSNGVTTKPGVTGTVAFTWSLSADKKTLTLTDSSGDTAFLRQ